MFNIFLRYLGVLYLSYKFLTCLSRYILFSGNNFVGLNFAAIDVNLIADYPYAALIEVSISEFSYYRFRVKSLVLINRQICVIGIVEFPPAKWNSPLLD